MKTLNYFFVILLAVSTAFAAPTRPKDATAAAAPAGDDKLLIDGTTNGTRALPASYYTTAAAAAAASKSADTITDGTTNKAFLATERTKLAGIATGATANSSDATLLSRANHTGTQPLSTISQSSATTNQVAQWNGSAWVAATIAAGGDVSQSSANAFTNANSTAIAFRTLRTDLAAGTSLAIGTHYFKTVTANLSLSGGFTGTAAEGSTTSLKITNSSTYTISGFPPSKRYGEAGSGITSITCYPGTHFLSWLYVGGEWTMSDTVGLLHNDTATTDPTTGSDATLGYTKRSLWINTSTGGYFVCVDPTASAAVWKRLDNTAVVAPAFIALTDAATITSTADPLKAVQNWTETLGGNRTQGTPSGLANGMTGVLIVKQDATGSRTLTLWSGSHVRGVGATTAITLTATANAIDILTWSYDGTNTYWTSGLGY